MLETRFPGQATSSPLGEKEGLMAENGRRRQVQDAKNQSLFREVNERVRNVADQNRIDLLCECADEDCLVTVTLTPDEYESIRANPLRFPVAPGHGVPEIERVVEEHDDYIVVEKIGLGVEVAEKLDPCSRSSAPIR
jgi:hypothetical protein